MLSERDLYPALLKLERFRDLGIDFQQEVPMDGKRVDLAGVAPSTQDVYAVEVKVRDWRTVVWQTRLNQLFADRAYIAMPVKHARPVDRDFLQQLGIGLILIDGDSAEEVLPATPSAIVSRAARETILSKLGDRSGLDMPGGASP